jgi:hypothetical protein
MVILHLLTHLVAHLIIHLIFNSQIENFWRKISLQYRNIFCSAFYEKPLLFLIRIHNHAISYNTYCGSLNHFAIRVDNDLKKFQWFNICSVVLLRRGSFNYFFYMKLMFPLFSLSSLPADKPS